MLSPGCLKRTDDGTRERNESCKQPSLFPLVNVTMETGLGVIGHQVTACRYSTAKPRHTFQEKRLVTLSLARVQHPVGDDSSALLHLDRVLQPPSQFLSIIYEV